MRDCLMLGLVLLLFTGRSVLAAETRDGMCEPGGSRGETLAVPLRPLLGTAIARESQRLARGEDLTTVRPVRLESGERGWIRRHPVLFGTILGAGIGAISSAGRGNELYCARGGDEECLFHGSSGVLFGAGFGAGIGAGIGALIGVLSGR